MLRVVLSVLFLLLSAWLVTAALAPSSGALEQALLLLLAGLLPLHLVLWQWEGIFLLDRANGWPRPFRRALAWVVAPVALASGPMVLYPLGLVAVVVAVFAGGAAAPALVVTGLLMLSPILALLGIAAMFVARRQR